MDQFLPGDVAAMVLRFLAASGCEESVAKMIQEHPVVRFYVPPKPEGMGLSDYCKILARPSLTPGLSDLLSDYAKAKLLVSQMLVKQNPGGSPIRQVDSLVTQLKCLNDVVEREKARFQGPHPALVVVPPPPSLAVAFRPLLVDVGVNTERPPRKAEQNTQTEGESVEFGCQTEDVGVEETVEEAEVLEQPPRDVPLLFYNALISDPTKLVTTINEYLNDGTSASTTDVVQKVCTQAESEIDKFMSELLCDEGEINGESSRLSNLFNDVSNGISDDGNQKSQTDQTFLEAPTGMVQDDLNLSFLSDKSESSVSNSISIPNQMKPKPGVKRIHPIPVAVPSPKAHPVFDVEPRTTVEKIVPRVGQPYSVRSANPVRISEWERLGRRSIAPKTPSVSSENDRMERPNSAPMQIVPPTPVAEPRSVSANLNSTSKASQVQVPGSCNKRKAKLVTPSKLTADRAKEAELTFFHKDSPRKVVDSEAGKTPQPAEKLNAFPFPRLVLVTSPISPYTPAPPPLQDVPEPEPTTRSASACTSVSYQTPCEASGAINPGLVSEVTPVLDLPSPMVSTASTSGQNMVLSPRLRGLVFSAQKIRATSTLATLHRKSLSTPRKKKHVRNLMFNTPPSLKGSRTEEEASPNTSGQLQPLQTRSAERRKRKAFSESPTTDNVLSSRSKKRLNYEKKVAYKSSAFPDRRFSLSDKSAGASGINETVTSEQQSTVPDPVPHPQLPSIFEEKESDNSFNANTSSECTLSSSVSLSEDSFVKSTEEITPPQPPPSKRFRKETAPKTPSVGSALRRSSRRAEVLAAQAVASSAVPLGRPTPSPNEPSRRKSFSPRKPRQSRSPARIHEVGPTPARTSFQAPVVSAKVPTPKKGKGRSTPKKLAAGTTSKSRNQSGGPSPAFEETSPSSSVMLPPFTGETLLTGNFFSIPSSSGQTHETLKLTYSTSEVGTTVSAPVVSVPPQATPVKEPPLPFHILPAPLGFPDPTPVKNPPNSGNAIQVQDLICQERINSNSSSSIYSLITPMKSSSSLSISPPTFLPPTPTPRYLTPSDLENDSNSNSNFGFGFSNDFLRSTPLSTPFKLTAPPPTPGRTIFLDKRNTGSINIRINPPAPAEPQPDHATEVHEDATANTHIHVEKHIRASPRTKRNGIAKDKPKASVVPPKSQDAGKSRAPPPLRKSPRKAPVPPTSENAPPLSSLSLPIDKTVFYVRGSPRVLMVSEEKSLLNPQQTVEVSTTKQQQDAQPPHKNTSTPEIRVSLPPTPSVSQSRGTPPTKQPDETSPAAVSGAALRNVLKGKKIDVMAFLSNVVHRYDKN